MDMKTYGKILIVMDESQEVLKQGIRIARDEKSRVTVLKVVPQCDRGGSPSSGLLSPKEREHADSCSIAWTEGVQVKTRVSAGDVTKKIVEVADEEKCDLIVMGAGKKRSILGRIFGDHVVEKVVNRAACPVFVIGSTCESMPEYSPRMQSLQTETVA